MVNQPFCKHDNDVGTNVHYHQNLKIRTEDFSALANFKIYINRYFVKLTHVNCGFCTKGTCKLMQ